MPRACTELEISLPAKTTGSVEGRDRESTARANQSRFRSLAAPGATTDLSQAQQCLQPDEEAHTELCCSGHEEGEHRGEQEPAAQDGFPPEQPRAVPAQRLREAVAVEEGAEDDSLSLSAPVVHRGLEETEHVCQTEISVFQAQTPPEGEKQPRNAVLSTTNRALCSLPPLSSRLFLCCFQVCPHAKARVD